MNRDGKQNVFIFVSFRPRFVPQCRQKKGGMKLDSNEPRVLSLIEESTQVNYI